MSITTTQKMLSVATAVTAVGFATGLVPAQAAPMFPLAPACGQYGFNVREFAIEQSNGQRVLFLATAEHNKQNESKFESRAIMDRPSDGTILGGGNASGLMYGSARIGVTVNWDTGEVAGKRSAYNADLDANGFASGTIEVSPGLTANWKTKRPFPCLTQQKTATVTGDVDVYNNKNEPDGAGQVIGLLRQGQQVNLVGDCAPSSWCQVSGAALPGGGNGWIWGHLEF